MVVGAETGRNLQPKCKAMPTTVGVWWAFAKISRRSKLVENCGSLLTRKLTQYAVTKPRLRDIHFILSLCKRSSPNQGGRRLPSILRSSSRGFDTTTMASSEENAPAEKSTEKSTMTPEDYAKQVKKATLRSKAMLFQTSRQLSEHANQQAANLAKQSEKIDQLQSQIQAKSAPKRLDRITNPKVKKHMQQLEHAQQVISQAKSVFEGHLDGSSPLSQLSEDQVAALKDQCDEGERTISDRMQFLEDWDSEGLEVASEMLRLRDEASKDPAWVSLVSRAKNSLAEKRKAADEAFQPSKDQKNHKFQNPRGNFAGRGRSPSPAPQWFHVTMVLG
jgi:hypothetical protein